VIRNVFLLLLVAGALAAAADLRKYHDAVTRYEAREYDQAVRLFLEFAAENPYEPEVKRSWFYMANALAEQGKCNEAVARANIALERYPAHPDRHELRVISGECLYQMNAHARADRLLTETRKQTNIEPLHYRIDMHRGFMAYDARSYAAAIKFYKSAIALANKFGFEDRNLFRVYRDLGTLLARDALQTESAVEYLSRAIQMSVKYKPGEAGALRLALRRISLRRIDKLNGLDDNSIADIRVDGDDVYIATWGAGLVRYTRSADKLEKIRLPSPQLRGLYADFDELYVTSFDGVYRYSKKTGETVSLSDEAGALKLGQKTIKDDRYVYFSTLNRGLIQYDTIKRKVVTLGKDSWVGSNQVYALDADLEYIVVGTLDKGAVIFHKKTGEVQRITTGEGALKSENVKAVLLDGRYVYIGAHNDGVYVYDIQQKKLTPIKAELPFPSAFARRDHEIFIGTSGQGLRVLDRNTNRLDRMTAVEGLSSNEIQILRVEGDFLWIGYLENGIDVVYRPVKEK
jgi:tetratricopeptide (TPR) repeat protein